MVDPKPGDVVAVGNALWAVIGSDGREMRLLRLNEKPEQKSEPPRVMPAVANSMTTEEVAGELGIAPKTVREYCKTGQLKGRKIGSSWRILRSENPMLAVIGSN